MSVNLKELIGKLNETTRTALEGAVGVCVSRTHYSIEIEHFLQRLLNTRLSDFSLICSHFGLDSGRVAAELNQSLERLKAGNASTPAFSPSLVEALIRGWLYGSIDYAATRLRSGFVLIALLTEDELSRLIRDISLEIGKIDVETLRRDFDAIMKGSVEAERAPISENELVGQNASDGPRVFISYRREDGTLYAESLFDRLLAAVPSIKIFRDIDTLEPGMVFSEKIDETVGACDILLALIGRKWLTTADENGARRLDKPDDWVRLEIAAALRHKKRVVPCLIGGAKMPENEELPSDLAGFELRHAIHMSKRNFRRDTEKLIGMMRTWRRSSESHDRR